MLMVVMDSSSSSQIWGWGSNLVGLRWVNLVLGFFQVESVVDVEFVVAGRGQLVGGGGCWFVVAGGAWVCGGWVSGFFCLGEGECEGDEVVEEDDEEGEE